MPSTGMTEADAPLPRLEGSFFLLRLTVMLTPGKAGWKIGYSPETGANLYQKGYGVATVEVFFRFAVFLPGFSYSHRPDGHKLMLRALIFDVHGTLADTERDGHRPAFNRAFAEAGLDWHWDAALYGELLAVTGGKERMRHYVDRHRPDYQKPADFEALAAR